MKSLILTPTIYSIFDGLLYKDDKNRHFVNDGFQWFYCGTLSENQTPDSIDWDMEPIGAVPDQVEIKIVNC